MAVKRLPGVHVRVTAFALLAAVACADEERAPFFDATLYEHEEVLRTRPTRRPDAGGVGTIEDAVPVGEGGPVSAKPTRCADPLAGMDSLPFSAGEILDAYRFSGTTEIEMREEIDAQTPIEGGFAAFTAYSVRWSFHSNDACRSATWDVHLTIEYTFPEWERSEEADPAVAAAWDRYVDALWCHELGHTAIAVDFVSAFVEAAGSLDAAESCMHLEIAAQDQFDALLVSSNDAQEQYDSETMHGATMGAIFP